MDGAGNKNTPIYNGMNIPELLPDHYIGLQASWEVDAWGKLKNKKKAATARYLSSVEGRNFIQTNIVMEVAGNYYDLLAYDEEWRILNKTIGLQEDALAIVRVQKEAGTANELAVNEFEAALLDLQSMRLQVQQQMEETEDRISLLTGRYPHFIVRDSSAFTDTASMF